MISMNIITICISNIISDDRHSAMCSLVFHRNGLIKQTEKDMLGVVIFFSVGLYNK